MQKYWVNRRIREIIEMGCKSQSKLEDRAGLKRGVLSRIVREKRPVYAEELPAICDALGISLDSLFEDWENAKERRETKCRE